LQSERHGLAIAGLQSESDALVLAAASDSAEAESKSIKLKDLSNEKNDIKLASKD